MSVAELDPEVHPQTGHETGWVLQKADEGGLAQRCSSDGSENRENAHRAPQVTCMEFCTLECPWVT